MKNPGFKKGDIIKSLKSYPCIVLEVSYGFQNYTIWVVDPTYPGDPSWLKCQWPIADDEKVSGIPKKIGRIHPEFIDLFLGDLK